MARVKKSEIVQVDVSAGQMMYITDPPSFHEHNPPAVHHAKILGYADGIMTMAFCVRRSHGLQYGEDDVVSLSYVELKDDFRCRAKIISIRRKKDSDSFSVLEMGYFLDENKYSYDAYDVYIVRLAAISKIVKHQRRVDFRSKIGTVVYYKIIAESDLAENDPAARFYNSNRPEEKNKAEQGYYEKVLGYGKLTTVDISAGGFKFLSPEKIAAATYLDCLIMLENEAVPAILKVIECIPENENNYYSVRGCYEKINNAIRNRVMKYIFDQERVAQKRLAGR